MVNPPPQWGIPEIFDLIIKGIMMLMRVLVKMMLMTVLVKMMMSMVLVMMG